MILTLNLTKHKTIYRSPKPPSRQYEFCWCAFRLYAFLVRFMLHVAERSKRARDFCRCNWQAAAVRAMLGAVTSSSECVWVGVASPSLTPRFGHREREKIRRNARVLARFLPKVKNNTNFAHFRCVYLHSHTHTRQTSRKERWSKTKLK